MYDAEIYRTDLSRHDFRVGSFMRATQGNRETDHCFFCAVPAFSDFSEGAI
jgi:hypothetical protein